MNWQGLELSILGPACLAGLLVLSTHVPLGQQVLSRGIIFIDLAIAQVAALGVILAQYFGMDEQGIGVEIAAAVAALAGGALLTWTDRKWPDYQEPLIGTLFVLAATGGLLLLANNPHGSEHLKDLLVGQILWVDLHHLIGVAISMLLIGLFLMVTRKKAITQILALLTVENAVFLVAVGVTSGMPLVVELGISFDVILAVLILGVLVRRIVDRFESMDISRLSKLKG